MHVLRRGLSKDDVHAPVRMEDFEQVCAATQQYHTAVVASMEFQWQK